MGVIQGVEGGLVAICLYFQLHQPFRLKRFRFKDVGCAKEYFDDDLNQRIFLRVAEKCYWPAGQLLLRMLREQPEFCLSFSISSTWLNQCRLFAPALLELFREIIAHERVELLCETSHHTLASLADPEEFHAEIAIHREILRDIFGLSPSGFRNTELIYSDEIGSMVHRAGFKYCLFEGWEPCLPSEGSVHRAFCHPELHNLGLLPRCYVRADDIAFRFSNRSWSGWPLTAERYQDSIVGRKNPSIERFVGIFMDFETLGEHQWAETGIFDFLVSWVRIAAADARSRFVLPGEFWADSAGRVPELSVNSPLSWADSERDVSAWLGSELQRDALVSVHALGARVKRMGDLNLTETWRRLMTSDHFYYMHDKCAADGEVHRYFSPYESPLDAYLDYRNVLLDFECRLNEGGENDCR